MNVSNKNKANDMSELTDSLSKLMEVQFRGVYKKIDELTESTQKLDTNVSEVNRAIRDIMISEAKHYSDCPNTKLCAEIQLQIAKDKLAEEHSKLLEEKNKLIEEKGNVLINAIKQYPKSALTLISVAVAGILFSAAVLIGDVRMRSQGLVSMEEFQKVQKETIHKEITSILSEKGYKNIP